MYNNSEEEYLRATRDAQVYTVDRKERRALLLFTNMLLFLALAIVGFLYFTQSSNYLSENIFGKKTAVLGATHRSTDTDYSDEELMVLLNNPDSETAPTNSKSNQQAELIDEMNQVIEDITRKSKSNYYESSISKELDDKSKDSKGRVVVVKKGDTLSSLAEKYYGNSMAFHKIIKHNKNITEQSHTLYVGEKINIPY